MTAGTQWRDHELRGHKGDHVTRECLVREGPKDKNSKVNYTYNLYDKLFIRRHRKVVRLNCIYLSFYMLGLQITAQESNATTEENALMV